MGASGAAQARLGRYELFARLAAGGMGEIFLARMEGAAGFEKLFVIKRILPHLADDPRFRDMLIGEARLAAMMNHANVCQVYELGETDGQLYIVMEYLEGATLLPLLRKLSKEGTPLDLGFIAGVVQQASDGLHYAHELKDRSGASLGIVHRDITPSNLFVTEVGVVKLLDFGIAKAHNVQTQTQSGVVKGKYAYMSPEQLRGGAVDRRSDVFALGVVTYEMLALRRLFQRKTDYLTFHAVIEQPIIDIRHFRPDCPDELAAVLTRALDRDASKRPVSARQFGAAVLDAVSKARRPWTQGEISDYITAHFVDELAKRSAQIATMAGGGGRLSGPILIEPDDGGTAIDDDFEFPPVDSAVGATPSDGFHVRGQTGDRAPFRVSTAELEARRIAGEQKTVTFGDPTPIAPIAAIADPLPPVSQTPTAAQPTAAQPTAPQPIVVVQHKRSLLWPMLAIAMVAVAAGALVLVWQQTQQTQNQQPVVIMPGPDVQVTDAGIIIGTPSAAPSGAPSADPPASNPPAGSGAQPQPKHSKPPPRPADPYAAAVVAKQAGVIACIDEHGPPPAGTKATIVIAPDGHARNVKLDPVSVDGTKLGSCIKDVLRSAQFPHAGSDRSLDVGVNLHPSA